MYRQKYNHLQGWIILILSTHLLLTFFCLHWDYCELWIIINPFTPLSSVSRSKSNSPNSTSSSSQHQHSHQQSSNPRLSESGPPNSSLAKLLKSEPSHTTRSNMDDAGGGGVPNNTATPQLAKYNKYSNKKGEIQVSILAIFNTVLE
jgi:hypothetical protein